MIKSEIIAKFHLFMDDTSELSSTEESDLFDKVYNKVMMYRPWEICRVPGTGTTSTSIASVALPTDFSFLLNNSNYTENNQYAGDGPVVFVGANYTPYKVVSYADRRQYRNKGGYCYVDIVNMLLVFTLQPVAAEAIEFDYCKVPTDLTIGGTPIFPARFHDVIYHGMCVDDFIIQQSDKAKSYASENNAKYESYLRDMVLWNARLIQI
jgi:hypothetical protein